MPTLLAVDLGKTGCRVAVTTTSSELTVIDSSMIFVGDGAVGLADAEGVMAAETAIVTTLHQRAHHSADHSADHSAHHSADNGGHYGGAPDAAALEPDYVSVGAAGAAAAPDAAHRLARRLGHRWPHAEIVVATDAATSHAGALAGQPGVVLAAGTGAVALAVGSDGTVVQVDGCGPWLGDDGSGAWIGRQALGTVLRGVDGRGPASELADAAARFYQCEPSSLPLVIGMSGNAPGELAAFAPEVARAAIAGNQTALGIIEAAAELLATSVCAAARCIAGLTAIPVALTGGLLQLGPVLLDTLTQRLQSADIELRPAHGTALDGARLLALHADTAHEPGLVRLLPGEATR